MKKLNPNSINTAEHYNKIFEKKGFKVAHETPLRYAALVRDFKGGRFLDIGCGLAPHSDMASKIEGSDIYAIDQSDKLIEVLKIRYPQIKYIVGDIAKLPFANGYFDYAVLGEVLEHTSEPSVSLMEIVRVLKAGGILALSVPFGDGGKLSPLEHTWSFTEQDITDLLKPFGKTEVYVCRDYRNYIIGYLTKC